MMCPTFSSLALRNNSPHVIVERGVKKIPEFIMGGRTPPHPSVTPFAQILFRINTNQTQFSLSCFKISSPLTHAVI